MGHNSGGGNVRGCDGGFKWWIVRESHNLMSFSSMGGDLGFWRIFNSIQGFDKKT